MSQRKMDPEYRAWDIVICPECGSAPADSRVLGETDQGAGIKEQKIWCEDCDTIYPVALTS